MSHYITCQNARTGTIRLGYKLFTWYARYATCLRDPYIVYVKHPSDGHMVWLSNDVRLEIIRFMFGD